MMMLKQFNNVIISQVSKRLRAKRAHIALFFSPAQHQQGDKNSLQKLVDNDDFLNSSKYF